MSKQLRYVIAACGTFALSTDLEHALGLGNEILWHVRRGPGAGKDHSPTAPNARRRRTPTRRSVCATGCAGSESTTKINVT